MNKGYNSYIGGVEVEAKKKEISIFEKIQQGVKVWGLLLLQGKA